MKQQENKGKQRKESLHYEVVVTDKRGKVLKRVSAPAHSFVRQWSDLMCSKARYTYLVLPVVTIKDTSGVDWDSGEWQLGSTSSSVNAGAGDTDKGIRVGKGTTAVNISDFALGSPLEEGTGLDQLEHAAVTFTVPSIVGSTCSFPLRRNMVNHSGATITGIKEIGVYMRFAYEALYALGFRDVLPSAVYVPDGGAITVTYTMAVTV